MQKKSQFCNLLLSVFTHKAKNTITTQQSIIISFVIQAIVSFANCLSCLVEHKVIGFSHCG